VGVTALLGLLLAFLANRWNHRAELDRWRRDDDVRVAGERRESDNRWRSERRELYSRLRAAVDGAIVISLAYVNGSDVPPAKVEKINDDLHLLPQEILLTRHQVGDSALTLRDIVRKTLGNAKRYAAGEPAEEHRLYEEKVNDALNAFVELALADLRESATQPRETSCRRRASPMGHEPGTRRLGFE
jgi:hypothetical protein